MTDERSEDDTLEGMSDLRALATLRDLDRRTLSQSTHLLMTRWLFLPVMLVALAGMIVGLVMGFGSPAPVIGGIVALVGGVAGVAERARRQADDLADLDEDRNHILRSHPSLQRHDSLGNPDHKLGLSPGDKVK